MALPDHAYSDSTDMVKIIVQTVQSQDRVLKELFGHLRYFMQKKTQANAICSFLAGKERENHGDWSPEVPSTVSHSNINSVPLCLCWISIYFIKTYS